jgi:hypothetical protein
VVKRHHKLTLFYFFNLTAQYKDKTGYSNESLFSELSYKTNKNNDIWRGRPPQPFFINPLIASGCFKFHDILHFSSGKYSFDD